MYHAYRHEGCARGRRPDLGAIAIFAFFQFASAASLRNVHVPLHADREKSSCYIGEKKFLVIGGKVEHVEMGRWS